ncbi:MAG: sigma-70 family RNA polymerase sigma factor [Candidatus Eisenbacteria bacterium]|nr:sigma-70 family RNA polymerase sigma factor [Candidatus Eisenbacteria bacterium]
MDRKQFCEKLALRDEGAWRQLFDEYGRLIYSVAVRLGFDDAARDDLFQDACLTILDSIDTLRDPHRLASWIYTLTYRLGIDRIRRRNPEVSLDEAPRAETTQGARTVQPEILRELERLEAAAQVLDALAHLDPRCRRLLRALYLEEPPLSYEQISAREGMPIGSIGPTRARCLQRAEKWLRGLSQPPPSASSGRSRRRQ